MIPARGPQTTGLLGFGLGNLGTRYPGGGEKSTRPGYWQLGLGTLRYPRYPGGDEKSTRPGYWQLGLGTLRYPRYPGGDEKSTRTRSIL